MELGIRTIRAVQPILMDQDGLFVGRIKKKFEVIKVTGFHSLNTVA